MAEYMSKEVFLSSMGLTGDETKYGNRDAEHQHRSYSTYMSYEIMDSVDDSIVEEELEPVRHGRWLDGKCTACGWEEPDVCTWIGYDSEAWIETPYCPNCGAKMDLEG